MNAIDTNIYLYAIDDAEPVKQRKAIDLLDRLEPRRSPVVLPWQVAVEYLNGLRRWARSGKVAAGRSGVTARRIVSDLPTRVSHSRCLRDFVVALVEILALALGQHALGGLH